MALGETELVRKSAALKESQEGHAGAEERSECAETCLWTQGALPWREQDKNAVILETIEYWEQPSA